MDDVQKAIIARAQIIRNNINSRNNLKATLLDIIPSRKLEINLILFAFDEGIVDHLLDSSDSTLQALKMIPKLCDSYGVTKELSNWSVISWCYILGKNDLAELLEINIVNNNSSIKNTQKAQSIIIGIGTYRAGYDFEPGDISLKHLTKDLQAPGFIKGVTILHNETIDCYINDSPSAKGAKKICSFADSCHLQVNKGEYLIITTGKLASPSMIKIELINY